MNKFSQIQFNEKSRYRLVLLFILVLTYFSFSPSLNNDFINWDDPAYVIDNKTIKNLSFDGIKEIFKSTVLGNYHPLTTLTFAVEYHFFQLTPRIYHLNTLLLHLINIILVYIFIFLLSRNRITALVTALLFGIHPMRVESVAWITERKDVLFLPFYLASLISYIHYLKSHGAKHKYLGFMTFWFLLALLSKPAAISLPIVLLLLDKYFDRKFKGFIKEKIPIFLCSLLLIGIEIRGSYIDLELANGIEYSFNIFDRIFMVCFAITLYVAKTLFPIPLSVVYPYPDKINALLPLHYYLSFFIIVALVLLIKRDSKNKREILFGCSFFFVTIFFNLPFLSIGYVIIADRFTYLPYIGLFYLIGRALTRLVYENSIISLKTKNWIKYIFLGFICWMVILTFQRCHVWKNSERLWTDVIEKFPRSQIAYHNRGLYFYGQDDFESASRDFNKALELEPNYVTAHFNLGNIAARHNHYKEAVEKYNKALEINPDYYYAYNNRGGMYRRLGQESQALKDFNRAIKIKPSYVDALINRGVLYFAQNDWEKAIIDFNGVLITERDNLVALNFKREILKKMKTDL